MRKTLLCLLLAACLLFSPPTAVRAEAAKVPATLSVEPSTANRLPAGINLYATGGTAYDLYLPGNVAADACCFSWAGGLKAEGGYESGRLPIPAPGATKTYTFSDGTQTASFTVTTCQGSPDVAPVFMEIDETKGTIAQMHGDPEHEAACSGTIYIDGEAYAMPSVKGRGNATWSMANEKRPYNVTLEKKATILGLSCEKTKKWSFLANISDHSLLRNQIGMELAQELGVGQAGASVDLWMNGDYRGVYLVTPKTDAYTADGGYALENDNYWDKPVEQGGDPQFSLGGLIFTVKKIGKTLLTIDGVPDESPANLTRQAEAIRTYIGAAWAAAAAADGYDGDGHYYTDYFDLTSWASLYLMHEYVKSFDVCGGSILFHRDGTATGDKLLAGPLWDLDNALGSTQANPSLGARSDLRAADGWYISALPDTVTALLRTLGSHPDFMSEVYRVYNRYRASFNDVPARVRALGAQIRASAQMNFRRMRNESYDTSSFSAAVTFAAGTAYAHSFRATRSYDDYVENLITFTSVRSAFLNDAIPPDDFSYPVTFLTSQECTVTSYDTAVGSGTGHPDASLAYARDPATGAYDKTGAGAVYFRLNLPAYKQLDGLTALPVQNYAALTGPDEAGLYCLRGVTGSVTVTLSAAERPHVFVDGVCSLCGRRAFRAEFACGAHCTVEGVPYAVGSDGSIDVTGAGQISFRPAVDAGFKCKAVTAQPQAYDAIEGPDEAGFYHITGVTGSITVAVETAPDIPDGSVTTTVDFTDSRDADKYEIINPDTAAVEESVGLTLVTTPNSFETAGGRLSGDAATHPRDLVSVPAVGDWTATLTFDFHQANAANGYYQYFGFYAMQDYANCVGIRCGEAAMQDFLRVDGDITAETKNAMGGVSEDGVYRLRIARVGDSYACYGARGQDAFTPLFSFDATGIDATRLAIDAYTGMTEGYRFTLQSLVIEGAACAHCFDGGTVHQPTCTAGGFTVFTCIGCGGSYIDTATAPLGHDLTQTTVEATCTAAGAVTCRCSRCDYAQTSTIDALGHSYVRRVCTRCGAKQVCTGMDCPSEAFTDAPGRAHWAHEGIDFCIGEGLMNGVSATLFRPNGTLTRGQLVTMLHRLAGEPDCAVGEGFPDVAQGSYYARAVAWAQGSGLVTGYPDGSFRPEGVITREQLAALLYRMAGQPSTDDTAPDFADAAYISAYALDAMRWATGEHILLGISSGGAVALSPQGSVTRAQAAAIVMRFSDFSA